MENKYEDMAWEVNREWMVDRRDGDLKYAGSYETACGAPSCWALISNFDCWALVDGIDVDFTIVDDEEQGELGVMDYYGFCGFDSLLAASLYIRCHLDPAFAPSSEELLSDLENTFDFENIVVEAEDILAANEAGVPMEDILA